MNKMKLHLNAWWDIVKREKYKPPPFEERFERLILAIERMQPYSICVPVKHVFSNGDEINMVGQRYSEWMVNVPRGEHPEPCFVDIIKLNKVAWRIESKKEFGGLNVMCHARVGKHSATCGYAISEDIVDLMDVDEIAKSLARALRDHFKNNPHSDTGTSRSRQE